VPAPGNTGLRKIKTKAMAAKGIYLIALLLIFNLIQCKMETDNELREIYTLGIWKVKPGMEQEFINAWTSFANWTDANFSGEVGSAFLLRDASDSLKFISFGPWNSETTIQSWRNSNEFKEFAAKITGLCDDFQPNTLKVASSTKIRDRAAN
jgi:heme-degrading monooxygenase HmoA